MKEGQHDHKAIHDILTSEGQAGHRTYDDLAHPPYDHISRILAWVKYRGQREPGNWCTVMLHDRLLVLLSLAEISYVVRETKVKFTIPDHVVSSPVFQLEVWWMRVNIGL